MKQVTFKSASLGTQKIFYVLSSSVDSLLCEGLYAPGSNDPGGPGGPGGPLIDSPLGPYSEINI